MDDQIRVLIVDDEKELCGVLHECLESRGYSVECAYDGATALTILERQRFDAVLTDIRIPGIDGLELIRIIRRRWPKVAVMVMTAHSSLEYALEAVRCGAHSFLAKPFGDLSDVLGALQTAVAEHKHTLQSSTPRRKGT